MAGDALAEVRASGRAGDRGRFRPAIRSAGARQGPGSNGIADPARLEALIPYPTTALREVAATVLDKHWQAVRERRSRGPRRPRLRPPASPTTEPYALPTSAGARRRSRPPRRPWRCTASWRGRGPTPSRPISPTSLNNLATMLSALGRREAALPAAEEAAALYRELAAGAARRLHALPRHLPQQPGQHAERSRAARGGAPGRRGGCRPVPRAGAGAARRLHARPRQLAQQPGQQAERSRAARGGAPGRRGGRGLTPRAGAGAARRLHARPGHVPQQPGHHAERSRAARGGAPGRRGGRGDLTASWRGRGPTPSRPTWPCPSTTWPTC